MTDIDVSKIKPGDTVRGYIQTERMADSGIAAVPFDTRAYPVHAAAWVAGFPVGESSITILEHIPARPDWADALALRIGRTVFVRDLAHTNAFFRTGTGALWSVEELLTHGPITVVLDADGNPPTPEPEWLDAGRLSKLPRGTAVVCKLEPVPHVHVKGHDGQWWMSNHPVDSETLAPARVLWAPEGDR